MICKLQVGKLERNFDSPGAVERVWVLGQPDLHLIPGSTLTSCVTWAHFLTSFSLKLFTCRSTDRNSVRGLL